MIAHLNSSEIEQVLGNNLIGRLGCSDGIKTYVVPVSYVYEAGTIIAHSLEGMKIGMMRKNPQVCFEVDEIHTHNEWKSVIAWGNYHELTDEQERQHAMQLFVERTLRMKISESAVLPEVHAQRIHPRTPGNIKPVVYRIQLIEKTGRYEKPDEQ